MPGPPPRPAAPAQPPDLSADGVPDQDRKTLTITLPYRTRGKIRPLGLLSSVMHALCRRRVRAEPPAGRARSQPHRRVCAGGAPAAARTPRAAAPRRRARAARPPRRGARTRPPSPAQRAVAAAAGRPPGRAGGGPAPPPPPPAARGGAAAAHSACSSASWPCSAASAGVPARGRSNACRRRAGRKSDQGRWVWWGHCRAASDRQLRAGGRRPALYHQRGVQVRWCGLRSCLCLLSRPTGVAGTMSHRAEHTPRAPGLPGAPPAVCALF